tara:strand:+ start:791 stop:1876 length:1086 start_codon:yes stop_codon:yes gene_type:complete
MSSSTYTLKIDLDDSKIRDLERRLMAIMNGKMAGLPNPSKPDKGGGLGKAIAKLGIIALGVGSLVGLVSKLTGMIVDSSPMLKGMLKLLNYSVMLILRPIGDFFGFFLRPLMIYFLRSVALPFYKQWRPIAQALGTWLGMSWMNRVKKVDDMESKKAGEPGFDFMKDGVTNLKKEMLYFAAFLDVFTKDESQTRQTEKAIANMEAIFATLAGIKIPEISFTTLETAIAGIKIPDLDWSVLLKSVTGVLIPTLEWSGLQGSIDTLFKTFGEYDFSKTWTKLETLISELIEDAKIAILKSLGIELPTPPAPEPTIINGSILNETNLDTNPWLPREEKPWWEIDISGSISSGFENSNKGSGRFS